MKIAMLLFGEFETLDVFGPVEIFGRLKEHYQISFYSLSGGLIKNSHGVSVMSGKLMEMESEIDIFIIPGTREEVNNAVLIDKIREISELSNMF